LSPENGRWKLIKTGGAGVETAAQIRADQKLLCGTANPMNDALPQGLLDQCNSIEGVRTEQRRKRLGLLWHCRTGAAMGRQHCAV